MYKRLKNFFTHSTLNMYGFTVWPILKNCVQRALVRTSTQKTEGQKASWDSDRTKKKGGWQPVNKEDGPTKILRNIEWFKSYYTGIEQLSENKQQIKRTMYHSSKLDV